MLKIYLTRHGETQWNIENRLQGSQDSPLTEKGVNNAVMLGERLRTIEFDAIYSSHSQRAFTTARIINSDKKIPIIAVEDLKEIHFGEWEGKTKKDIEANIEYHNFWNQPHVYNHIPHKGEGMPAFRQRVENVIRKILSDHVNGSVLIVTHAVVIRAIMSFTMNISIDKMWDPPFIHGTSLTLFDWDGTQFNFEMIGDTAHFMTESK